MLDITTKQKIDSLRNLLVGKVPDPKSQVEQITVALFYKFMWDRDKEIKDLGGNATFFVGEFEKYSWDNLFAPELGGSDRIKLYSEAIEEMENNPNIPSIFRDIFKRAFLPYNDPYTLKLFLSDINDFHYSNSEKLGDGFEYLLSILGTQGDAGQFRTPRHIIDFITEVVNPQKGDRIVDPACGTAGFIISAYKHILKTNTKESLGDLLTPEDKKRLGNNLVGLDIDPMMVKLALANMYLHGLNEPHIYEYDSLTSEERWDDMFDVVLANPPFMTPSGGIRPHKRFAVNATKAEVLFTSYINTHLSNNGRAGIIVPEGIIYRTGIAYKELRKQLIESSLIGVISLPSGVFNPYSGVKTSILLLDKSISKKTDKIFFTKVENDGFDLGDNRNPIDKDDLPKILNAINKYCNDLNSESVGSNVLKLITKDEILNSSVLSLNFEIYSEKLFKNKDFDYVKIGQCCKVLNGSTPKRSDTSFWNEGTIPWMTVEDLRKNGPVVSKTIQHITKKALENTSVKLLPVNTVVISCTATIGEVGITEIEVTTNQQFNGLIIKEDFQNKILPKFLFWILKKLKNTLIRISGKTSFNYVSVTKLKDLYIPIPPIQVQKELIQSLNEYEKEIDNCNKMIINYSNKIEDRINQIWGE